MLFSDMVGSLILEVRCIASRNDVQSGAQTIDSVRTFAGNSKENNAAWFGDVGSHQTLYQVNVARATAATHASNQSYERPLAASQTSQVYS